MGDSICFKINHAKSKNQPSYYFSCIFRSESEFMSVYIELRGCS